MTQPSVQPIIATSVGLAKVDPRSIEKRDPGIATLALEMLASGATYEDVERATQLSFTQIAALKGRHSLPLEERRKQLAADGFEMAEGLRLLAKKKMQQLADSPEDLKKTSLKDLVLPYAIAQDKAFSALGENKTVIEHRGRGATLEDAQKEIEAARAKIRAEALEVKVEEIK